jgi:hypothetical protein
MVSRIVDRLFAFLPDRKCPETLILEQIDRESLPTPQSRTS